MRAYRKRLYRLIFAAAAGYNLAFGVWAAIWPRAFFAVFDLEPPRYPSIWACLGMVVGLYGVGYAYAAWRLDRATPFIAIGLLGKVLGPCGWLVAVASGEWPVRTLPLIVFNDIIWWLPFALFLIDGTHVSERIRALAPYACGALNFAAVVAMALALRFGTELVPAVADRLSYMTQHWIVWRAGWGLWIAAALSLAAFYSWWGSFLQDARWGTTALVIVSMGLVCDLLAESLLIGWLPRNYDRVAPLTTLLTGGAANGLYTVAGVILTMATDSLRGWMRVTAWTIWAAGAALTICAIAGFALGIAVSTTVLFVLFCPWVVWLGRFLQDKQPSVAR